MKPAIFLALVVLFAALGSAQTVDLSGKVSFVSFSTYKLSVDGKEEFAPHVLVGFTEQDGPLRSLVLTDQLGSAVLPLRAGRYCVATFGLDGRSAALSSRSMEEGRRCFTAIPNKMIECSVTLAADAKYGGEVPPLVVQ
jgi:hypothetical protein